MIKAVDVVDVMVPIELMVVLHNNILGAEGIRSVLEVRFGYTHP